MGVSIANPPAPAQPQAWAATAAAWAVHLLTGTGALLGLLALLAVERGAYRIAFAWLFVALAVDGIDGALARRAQVSTRAPAIDGATLDLVVDYLTYVFVPAMLMLRAGIWSRGMALPAAAAILISSLYT
ncbi:MAG: phosphatidylcholine/phosphatidylserine synthase, partial [Alphaproteobacteria bacterium]|nr:phosphatidylcholine/phosphatidylserine synthase [Alphaproteobacteria bacterium]